MMSDKIVWRPVPTVLEIAFFEMPASAERTIERTVKDYELDLFISGGGKIFVDDECYDISPAHIMFRKPGQRCYSTAPYSCYTLTLDFSGRVETKNYFRKRPGAPQPITDHPCFNLLLPYMRLRSPAVLQRDFLKIYELNRLKSDNDNEKYALVLTDLFLNLLCDTVYRSNRILENNEPFFNPSLRSLCEWLRLNFKEKITLNDMANRVNLSPNYLHRLFLNRVGVTPNNYLRNIRLEQACQLLIDTDNSVEWVSEQSGFGSIAYFAKVFKATYGITPRDFRKNHR